MRRITSCRRVLLGFLALTMWLLTAGPSAAQNTTTLTVSVAAAGTLSVTNATTTLSSAGGFGDFTGTTSLLVSVRTTTGGGSGSATLSFASDWSPANGPSIPGTSQLTYTCSAFGGGPPLSGATPCAGTQTVTALGTPYTVATFSANSHVNAGTETQSWTLVNDPAYETGTYTTTATYTLSVT